jgi:hypothetical protein
MNEFITNLIMKYLNYNYKYWARKSLEDMEYEYEKIRWRDLTMAFAKFKEK